MMEFIQNPWVVGIGTGIISGIVVYIITRWLIKRKDKSSYYEKINTANADIIRVLRPYVVEKGLLDESTIDGIKLSTARKYRVNGDDLYSVRDICEDLMREIIENAYFSSDKKQELLIQLQQYLEAQRSKQDETKLVPDMNKEIKKRVAEEKEIYSRRYTMLLSVILSTALLFLLFFVVTLSKSFDNILPYSSPDVAIQVFAIAIVTMGTLYSLMLVLRDIIKRKQRLKEKKEE